MTLGKKHLWTKVSLVKALVNWGPRVGVPAEHHVSGRVLAERALRLFPHQQKCKSFTGSRDHPGAAGLLGRNVSSDRTGASAGPTRPLSMTTALPGTSDYTSTDPGLPGLNLDVPIIGISIYSTPYNFPIINTKS